MILWMMGHSEKMRGKLQGRIDVAITMDGLFGIAVFLKHRVH